jgi:hypothetical protein
MPSGHPSSGRPLQAGGHSIGGHPPTGLWALGHVRTRDTALLPVGFSVLKGAPQPVSCTAANAREDR